MVGVVCHNFLLGAGGWNLCNVSSKVTITFTSGASESMKAQKLKILLCHHCITGAGLQRVGLFTSHTFINYHTAKNKGWINQKTRVKLIETEATLLIVTLTK